MNLTLRANLLVATAFNLLCFLIAIHTSAQTISTVAGANTWGDGGLAPSSFVNLPSGVAVDKNGVVYIADTGNNRIRKITADGFISTVAGNGLPGFRGDGGAAVDAQLHSPYDVAVDKDGNLFIADKDNNAVRKVTSTGTITTLVGCCGSGSDGGPASKASVFQPSGVAVDSAGNVYIAETGSHTIRKISTDGIINTVAGSGANGFSGDGGPATSAKLYEPYGVAVDMDGNIYIADRRNNRIRKVSTTGIISTVAGIGANSYSGDGGLATSAALALPTSVAVDKNGNLFIADNLNMRVRKVNPSGIISTVAGNGLTGFGGDGGLATSARLYYPAGVAVKDDGTFYIADGTNTRVRKVTPTGMISTLAGNGKTFSDDGGLATKADLYQPSGVAIDGQGNFFIADQLNHQVRKVSPTGIISTIAGTGTFGYNGDGGAATSAQLNNPTGVAVDRMGNVFVADLYNRRIRKVSLDGTISTVAGDGNYDYKGDGGPATSASMKAPTGVAVDDNGNLYFADRESNTIRKVSTTGIITRINTSVGLIAPMGIVVDKSGNLFIADAGNYVVRKISTTGTTTVAGNGIGQSTGDGGQATSAGLSYPTGVAVDTEGNLFIADQDGNRVRKVTSAGSITTVAGNGVYNFSGDSGLGTRASLAKPTGVAVDGSGNIFIADLDNNRIRKLTAPNTSPTVAGGFVSQTATVGQAFSYTLPANTFTDTETPNGLILSVSSLPAGLSFTAPATISGIPTTATGSPFSLTVTATDPGQLSVSTTLTLTIQPEIIGGADLTPNLYLPQGNFAASGPESIHNLTMTLAEQAGKATNGVIVLTLTAPLGYSLGFDPTLTSINVTGGTTNPVNVNNAIWEVKSQFLSQMTLTSKTGQGVGARGISVIGLSLTRSPVASAGTANLTVNVNDDATNGYDSNPANNIYVRILNSL